MPTTALGLHYPASTDNVQIWTHLQTLATDADTAITVDRARITALEGQLVGTKYATGGTLATSSSAEVAMTAWTGGDATVTFANGYLYEVRLSVGAYDAGTAGVGGSVIVRVRRTVNSTAAAVLLQKQVITSGGDHVKSHDLVAYAKNASGGDIAASLGLTVEHLVGGNASIYGNGSGLAAIVTVRRIGLSSAYAALATVAWAVT